MKKSNRKTIKEKLYLADSADLPTKIKSRKVSMLNLDMCVGNYLAENIYEKWQEDFVDEDTGEVVSIDRHTAIFSAFQRIDLEMIKKLEEFDTSHINDIHIVDCETGFFVDQVFSVFGKATKAANVLRAILGLSYVDVSAEKDFNSEEVYQEYLEEEIGIKLEKHEVFISNETLGNIAYPTEEFDFFKQRSFAVSMTTLIKPVLKLVGCEYAIVRKHGIRIKYHEQML